MAHDVAELLHLLWRLNDKDDVRQSLEEPSAPCADIATLELEIPNDGDSQPNWRLYRVNQPDPGSQ